LGYEVSFRVCFLKDIVSHVDSGRLFDESGFTHEYDVEIGVESIVSPIEEDATTEGGSDDRGTTPKMKETRRLLFGGVVGVG
jgi:hypothetical protein